MKNFSVKLHLQADARAEHTRYFGADKYMQRRRLGKGDMHKAGVEFYRTLDYENVLCASAYNEL